MKKVLGVLFVLVALAFSACTCQTEPIEAAIDSTIVVDPCLDTCPVAAIPVDTCKVVKP